MSEIIQTTEEESRYVYHHQFGPLKVTVTETVFHNRYTGRGLSRHVVDIDIEERGWLTEDMRSALATWLRFKGRPAPLTVSPPDWLVRTRSGGVRMLTEEEAQAETERLVRAASGRVRRPRVVRLRRDKE